ncbi:MAG: heavy metal translocating P-type ATPase [bacterium]
MSLLMLLGGLALGRATYIRFRNKRPQSDEPQTQKNQRQETEIPATPKPTPLAPAEKSVRQQQYTALSALGLSALGTVTSPVIALGAIPLLAYNYFSLMKEVRDAFKNKGKLIVSLFDAASVTLAIFMGSLLVVAFLLTVLYSARRLIARTERQTQADFNRIFAEISTTAWLLKDNVEIEVPLNSLKINDVIVVHAGDMIPVDGCIVAGEGMLDQHLLTGEFQPTEKKVGDTVFTSTLLISGTLQICVEKQGSETITGQIAKTLEHAAEFKQQMQSRGDEIVEKGASRTLLACGAALPFMGFGQVVALSYSGFGYQMRAAAPLMIFNYLRIASQNGVLIKDGRALDKLQNINTIVFDKTGTLTEEIPQIIRINACADLTEERLLQYAASVEQRQKHPVGLAICHYAQQQGIQLLALRHSEYAIGHGLRAELFDPNQAQTCQNIIIGSRRFIETAAIAVPDSIERMQTLAGEQGHSVVYMANGDGQLLGAIELGPILRPQVKETVATLHDLGIETYIISGDQEKPTRNLAHALGIEHYFAETLPEEKANIVARLQSEGRTVCFMGDGINDSVALQKADVSISLHGAATIAQDTADIVLMEADLQHLPYLLSMSKELNQRMNRSELMNNAFGIACMGSVIVLGMGLSGAMLLYASGMMASLSNAMLPLWKPTSDIDKLNHPKS